MGARKPDYQQGQNIPGTVYRVHRVLGAGGMGTVYEVEDTSVGRRYVLKTLHGDLANRADLAARLSREARALAKLQHLNIVEVYTSGTTQDQLHLPYYVMERLDGQSLRTILTRKGGLPLEQAYDLAIDLLDALDHAHEHGIIHRDVKPDNIFITRGRDGRSIAKLLDFGIIKLQQTSSTVQTGGFLGTFRYAAPEQILGREITPHTDLYSAALVLYEMVAGRGPFDDLGSEVDIGKAHVQTTPPPLSRFVQVPAALEDLVATMLAKNVQDRPLDAYTVGRSLRDLKRELHGASGSAGDVHEKATVAAVVGVQTNVAPQTRSVDGAQTRALPPTDENGVTTMVPVTSPLTSGTVAPDTPVMPGAPPQAATRYDNTMVSPEGSEAAVASMRAAPSPSMPASTLPLSMQRPPELEAALSQHAAAAPAPFARREQAYGAERAAVTPVPMVSRAPTPVPVYTTSAPKPMAAKLVLVVVGGLALVAALVGGAYWVKKQGDMPGASGASAATATTPPPPALLPAPTTHEEPSATLATAGATLLPTTPTATSTTRPTHTHHRTTPDATSTPEVSHTPATATAAPTTTSTPPPKDTTEPTVRRPGSGL